MKSSELMISVILPVKNGDLSLLKRAVSSIKAQTYKKHEIIMIDDGSRKAFSKKLDTLAGNDSHIHLFHIKPSGVSYARNYAVSKASGDIITYLDADDFWRKDKLLKQMKVMKKYKYNGSYPSICFTARRIVYKKKKSLKKGPLVHAEKIVDYKRLLRSNQINCSSVLMRTDLARRFPFPDGDIHEDYVVWLNILRHGGYAAGIDEPLLDYYVSKNSKSGNKLRSAIMTYRVYKAVGLGTVQSMYHMISYTIQGLKKYRLRTLLRQISF
jgi:teichuronic acid biosynthesis glycosyltransferase TuaG